MRHPLVMGNWKLNGSRHMVHELVSNLRKELAGVAGCALQSHHRKCTSIWRSAKLKAATSCWVRKTWT